MNCLHKSSCKLCTANINHSWDSWHTLLVGRGPEHRVLWGWILPKAPISTKGIATSTYLSNERGKSCQLTGHQVQSIIPPTLTVTTNIGIEITYIIIPTAIEPVSKERKERTSRGWRMEHNSYIYSTQMMVLIHVQYTCNKGVESSHCKPEI